MYSTLLQQWHCREDESRVDMWATLPSVGRVWLTRLVQPPSAPKSPHLRTQCAWHFVWSLSPPSTLPQWFKSLLNCKLSPKNWILGSWITQSDGTLQSHACSLHQSRFPMSPSLQPQRLLPPKHLHTTHKRCFKLCSKDVVRGSTHVRDTAGSSGLSSAPPSAYLQGAKLKDGHSHTASASQPTRPTNGF